MAMRMVNQKVIFIQLKAIKEQNLREIKNKVLAENPKLEEEVFGAILALQVQILALLLQAQLVEMMMMMIHRLTEDVARRRRRRRRRKRKRSWQRKGLTQKKTPIVQFQPCTQTIVLGQLGIRFTSF